MIGWDALADDTRKGVSGVDLEEGLGCRAGRVVWHRIDLDEPGEDILDDAVERVAFGVSRIRAHEVHRNVVERVVGLESVAVDVGRARDPPGELADRAGLDVSNDVRAHGRPVVACTLERLQRPSDALVADSLVMVTEDCQAIFRNRRKGRLLDDARWWQLVANRCVGVLGRVYVWSVIVDAGGQRWFDG